MEPVVEIPGDELVVPPPRVTAAEAGRVAAELFDVEGEVIALGSERDRNFRITSSSGHSFVLKFANPAEAVEVLDMQVEALRWVARTDPELPVPRVRLTREGELHGMFTAQDGRRSYVRLLTYLEGTQLEPYEMTAETLRALGATSARLGRALRGFFHPAAGRPLLWDLKRAGNLMPLLQYVEDRSRRAVAERMLTRFLQDVAPRLDRLRAQVIHNDVYSANVLIDEGRDQVTGVIDFGDMLHAVLVQDLAVTTADIMGERTDPFAAARLAIDAYSSVIPLEPEEMRVVPELVIARMLAMVAIAEWRATIDPDNIEYIMLGIPKTWAILEKLDDLGPEEVHRRFATGDDAGKTDGVPAVLLERRLRVMSPVAPLSYRKPLHIVRGSGVWLFDPEGQRYLDAYNNVPVAGHAHPRIVEVIGRQAGVLNTNTRYLHETVVEASERLVATMSAGLDTVLWVNSGSEAIDVAWRLAKLCTGKKGAMVTACAYHGITAGSADLSSSEWPGGERPAGVATIPPPDRSRKPLRDPRDRSKAVAEDVRAALNVLDGDGSGCSACFVDSCFASDGILIPPPDYLPAVAAAVREAGGLFVADEVQAGFGRIGTSMWSFEAAGVAPDVVVLGKPMGNGFPVGAVVTRREIVDHFGKVYPEFFSTFGGNTLAAAVALEVLRVVEEEGLRENAASVGGYLLSLLRDVAEGNPAVAEVRGAGLMIGVEIVRDSNPSEPAPERCASIVEGMRERGVLIGSTGPAANVLKIRPPLVFAREHADLLAACFEETLSASREPPR